MITLNYKDKEFKLVPRTRKVVDLTDKLKAKNLNELIFNSINNDDVKVLAELIKSFGETEEGKQAFNSINEVYDFIDDWKGDNGLTINELFKDVAKVVNEMGFFKKKMSEKELEEEFNNPMGMLDLQEMMMNSAQKMVDQIAEEEFKGYKG